MDWNNAITTPPSDGQEVIVYTEEGKMKVCVYFKGRWSTYMRVTHWMEKPKAPEDTVVEKKRGRPRNDNSL